MPETRYELDAEAVRRFLIDGTVEEVRFAELVAAEVRTTSEGPFAEDVFFVLHGPEGTGCVVPQSAPICDALLARLQALPGFDNQAVIDAMTCTEDQVFRLWTRPSG